MNMPFLRRAGAIALCLLTASATAAEGAFPYRMYRARQARRRLRPHLQADPGQPDGNRRHRKPMRVTYMPGGVGAVAYNAIVAQRPGEPGTVVAFSGGSLLNLAQGKFGRYGVDDVRWLASVGTDYGMIAVRADSPWKDLPSFMAAMEKIPPVSSSAPAPPLVARTG